VFSCHTNEASRAVQTGRRVTARGEGAQVASGPAAEVEDAKGRVALDLAEQRVDVLRDVVVARAQPELLCVLFVVRECDPRDFVDCGARVAADLVSRAAATRSAPDRGARRIPKDQIRRFKIEECIILRMSL
jgi:hypothetical protein